jgi:hypothetical protein
LVRTFTDPTAADTGFGWAVAGLGESLLLIGAPFDQTQSGAAYLLDLKGTLLTMFTNPNPAKVIQLGRTAATLGGDRVIVGGLADSSLGAPYIGGLGVFNTNGALLTILTNPVPAHDNGFGNALALLGADRVIVGAPTDSNAKSGAGSAYLLDTNGTLLATFLSPNPVTSGGFGTSVAAVGSDTILIGEVQNGGSPSGGAAYLFTTNATLKATFRNPTPAVADFFGRSVAAVGSSLVLVGASGDDTGAQNAGCAYLFRTDGTLLMTITNPAPADPDAFGSFVAAMGNDRIIIAANQDSLSGSYAGTAYLFALPYPSISITANASTVSLQWLTSETGLVLQETASLDGTAAWSRVTNQVSAIGATNVVQQAIPAGNAHRFYRLQRP